MFLLLIGASVAAWVSFWHVIPGALRSLFVSHLWRIRDELADATLTDRFENRNRAVILLAQVAELIKRAEDISVGKLLLLRALDPSGALVQDRLAGLASDDEPLLRDYADRIRYAANRHARWMTPSGWLLFWLPWRPVKDSDISRLLAVDRYL